MYRRPKFLEVILKIREEMAREADYDVDFFAEMVRNGIQPATDHRYAVSENDNGNLPPRTVKQKRERRSPTTRSR